MSIRRDQAFADRLSRFKHHCHRDQLLYNQWRIYSVREPKSGTIPLEAVCQILRKVMRFMISRDIVDSRSQWEATPLQGQAESQYLFGWIEFIFFDYQS